MRLLLDTCTFIWWLGTVAQLPRLVHDAIADRSNEVFISTVTPWEIRIKLKLGKIADVPAAPDAQMLKAVQSQGLNILPVLWPHAARAGELPLHHRDPFDRMLVAQAQVEKLALLSPDPLFTPYDVDLMWR